MTDAHTTRPASRTRRRGGRRGSVASTATAALGAALVVPAVFVTGPVAAAAPPAAACAEALPYGASASADLLRLGALDLRPLGLALGPVADVRIASTSAGMAANADAGANDDTGTGTGPAAAAAARDVAADLLGLDVGLARSSGAGDAAGLLPAAGLGHTTYQQAPPSNPEPDRHPGHTVDLGLLRATLGGSSAHATWQEPMRCGAETGPAGVADAVGLAAAVLPAPGGRALVALPDNLSSHAETELVGQAGGVAARATASASLIDLRLFAGSDSEVAVKVISEPELEVTATGQADSSSVRYQAPLLEISGPGIGTERLDTPGAHLDLALPGSAGVPELGGLPVLGGGDDPVADLLAELTDLSGLRSGPAPTERPLELAGLPGLPGVTSTGRLPILGEVLSDASTPAGVGELSVLRLSIGQLDQRIADESVSASAASLRLQLLAWRGDRLTERASASAVLDLGIGLLEAAATAPAPAAEPPVAGEPGEGGGGCGDCPGGRLPVTGPAAVWLLAGAGVLLAVMGRLLMLATRGGRRQRIRRSLLG